MAIAALLAIGVVGATAHAQTPWPALQINLRIDDGLLYEYLPFGNDADEDGTWSYLGFWDDSGLQLTVNLNADPDPSITGGIILVNPFDDPVDVLLDIVLPIAPAIPGNTLMVGSAAVGLTTQGPGNVQTINGIPLWQGMIDGSPVVALYDDFFELDHTGSGSSAATPQNFGIGFPPNPDPLPGPPALSTIGIRLNFRLTGGTDQFSLTGGFLVTPAPAGFLVLAGGLFVRRRRRD